MAFKIAPLQFHVAQDQAYISIRDQAVRVRTLVQAMEEAGMLEDVRRKNQQVLVAGAGFAGVSLAMMLARRNVRTVLVDGNEHPFSPQRECGTRYLSLTQYDWPFCHFDSHDYPEDLLPPSKADHLVNYTRKTDVWVPNWGVLHMFHGPYRDHLPTKGTALAKDLVKQWDVAFRRFRRFGPFRPFPLDWMPEHKVVPPSSSQFLERGGLIEVPVQKNGTAQPVNMSFAYAFFTTGFGTDGKSGLGVNRDIRTLGFWDDDRLAELHWMRDKRVLIAGGGDGALQDLIRILVPPDLRTAAEVLNALKDHMSRTDVILGAWSRLESVIAMAEMQAGQASTWSGRIRGRGQSPSVERMSVWYALQDTYDRAIAKFAVEHGPALFSALSAVLSRPMSCKEVIYAHPDNTPGKCYALNRLIFSLFKLYFDAVQGEPKARWFDHSAMVQPYPIARFRYVPRRGVVTSGIELHQHPLHYTVPLKSSRSNIDVLVTVDELVLRLGIELPVQLLRSDGLHAVGMELGRIKLPFVSVE